VIGRRDRFSARLSKAIDKAESIASEGDLTVVIAADYGGCWDITEAARRVVRAHADGQVALEDISESSLSQYISTSEFPPLDLLVRTGGEYRISNFLLWQAAYAELYFSPLLWPEFGTNALNLAVDEFYSRQRRYGKTSDQIISEDQLA